MATNYSLTVYNNSVRSGFVCVYTTCPDPQAVQLNLKSLAWFVKSAQPSAKVTFRWTLDYSFVWCETGELTPGVFFEASQNFPADPAEPSLSKVFFDKDDIGAYGFTKNAPSGKTPPPGTLGIFTSSGIPNNDVSIGIGLGGSPALVTSATPNFSYCFIPKIKYWVAFGTYTEGEVLDLNAMTSMVQEIAYGPSEYSKTATLNADNTWSVSTKSALKARNDLIRAGIRF